MWPLLIVALGPGSDHGSGMVEAHEQGFVEHFVPQAAVERLCIAVLHWLGADRHRRAASSDNERSCDQPQQPGTAAARSSQAGL